MAELDLQEVHDVLVEVAKEAGAMITAARPAQGALDTKVNCACAPPSRLRLYTGHAPSSLTPVPVGPTLASDLVTETDRAVEAAVAARLRARFPGVAFMGEETYTPGTRLADAPAFVVDPIDGTTNFVHAHGYVAVSLAYVVARRPRVGVVYDPFAGRLYHAIKGQGAYLTTALPAGAATPELTRRLPLRPLGEEPLALERALVAIEWGNERSGSNWEVKTRLFSRLAGAREGGGAMVQGFRSLGSAALNLCAVAAGGLDAYWEGGCWAWDVAAGWVVLAEAGGLIVGGNPGEWEAEIDARRYLAIRAADSETGDRFIRDFWGCMEGRLEYEL